MVFQHVGLSVANLERSISFYRDLLGFEFVRIIECPADSNLGRVVGLNPCAARLAHLRSGTMLLELLAYTLPQGKAISSEHIQADKGFSHIGFESSDIHADYDRLNKAGVKFYGAPIEYRPTVWVAYFRGPDNESCELRQVTGE